MSRIARVVVPGEPHHLIQRGNRRAAVFHADNERQTYLRLLRDYAALHRLTLWAYCLMTNHIHLIAVPHNEQSIARTLRGLHTVYAMQYNTRHHGTGHLWQGRYKSCPLDEQHTWAAVRYVERNPVRAGMVARAEDYPWSSAPAHCGLKRAPLLDPAFPPPGVIDDWSQRLRIPEEEETTTRIRTANNTGRPFGSPAHITHIETLLNRPLQPRPPAAPRSQITPNNRNSTYENKS